MRGRLRIGSIVGLLMAAGLAAPMAGPSEAATVTGSRCVRGRWYADEAESNRVLQALAPGPYTMRGQLYVNFDGRIAAYGSSAMELKVDLNGTVMTAAGNFLNQGTYTTTSTKVRLGQQTSTLQWDSFSATTPNGPVSVPGPPGRTETLPAAAWPYECRGNQLKLKLPQFASKGWIVFARR